MTQPSIFLHGPGDCLTSLRARIIENTPPDTFLPALELAMVHWALAHLRMSEADVLALQAVLRGMDWPDRLRGEMARQAEEEAWWEAQQAGSA